MGQIHSLKRAKSKVVVRVIDDNVVNIDCQKNVTNIPDIAKNEIDTLVISSCTLSASDVSEFASALAKNSSVANITVSSISCKSYENESTLWSSLLHLEKIRSFSFNFCKDSKVSINDTIKNIAKLISNNICIENLKLSFKEFKSVLQDDWVVTLCTAFVSAKYLTNIKFDAIFTPLSEDVLRLAHKYNQSIYQLDSVFYDTAYISDRTRMLNGCVDFWCEMIRGKVLMHYEVNKTCSEMLAHYPAFKYVLQYTFNHEVAQTLHDDIFRICPLLRLSSVCKSFYRLLEGEKPVAASQTQSTLMNMPDEILRYIFALATRDIEKRRTPEEFKLAIDAITTRQL